MSEQAKTGGRPAAENIFVEAVPAAVSTAPTFIRTNRTSTQIGWPSAPRLGGGCIQKALPSADVVGCCWPLILAPRLAGSPLDTT